MMYEIICDSIEAIIYALFSFKYLS